MKADITPQEYEAFKKFLQDACGILLGDNKQYLVKSRLRRILEENSLNSLGELLERLKRPGRAGLREVVIDAMTTNETLWFRDNHPFRILQEKLLPEFAERSSLQPLRIWSSACSTGQEPYSVAMVIDEFRRTRPGKLRDVKITATDISKSVLEVARRGEYEMIAIGRGLSPERQKHFFTPPPAGYRPCSSQNSPDSTKISSPPKSLPTKHLDKGAVIDSGNQVHSDIIEIEPVHQFLEIRRIGSVCQ